jgi:hypothetical protein
MVAGDQLTQPKTYFDFLPQEPSVAAAASSTYTSEGKHKFDVETSDTPSSSRPAGGDSGQCYGME